MPGCMVKVCVIGCEQWLIAVSLRSVAWIVGGVWECHSNLISGPSMAEGRNGAQSGILAPLSRDRVQGAPQMSLAEAVLFNTCTVCGEKILTLLSYMGGAHLVGGASENSLLPPLRTFIPGC